MSTRLHVKIFFKKFLNSIKLFLLFSTEISSTKYRDVQYRVPRCPVPITEMSHMFSTEMSRSRDVLIPLVRYMKEYNNIITSQRVFEPTKQT